MDRRTKRMAATAVETMKTTRASSKSPSRRSSRNRSPARTSSPARTKNSQRRSGRNKLTDNDTASETDDSKSDFAPKLSVRVSPVKVDKDSIQKLITKNRKTPTNNKIANISEGDDEVASLTAKYVNDKDIAENPTPSDLSAKRSYSRSMSRSLIDEEWSQSDTSDKNDDPIFGNRITRSRSKTHKICREPSLSKDAAQFGGSIGAALILILLPTLCFITQYVCSRDKCQIKSVRWERFFSFETIYTLESGYIYLALVWIVCLFSIIPYTGIKRQLSQITPTNKIQAPHNFNGFATAIFITGLILISEFYFKYPMHTIIYRNYQRFCFVGFCYALIVSIWCFVRSIYVPVTEWNPNARSGRLVCDLFVGRELNPKWWKIFSVKLIFRRVALISVLIFNVVFLIRNIKFETIKTIEAPITNYEIFNQFIQSVRYDSVAATVSILIICNILDQLLFEHHLTSSFELQNEGVGAHLLISYAAYPVWQSLIAKFALQHSIANVPNWLLISISLAYVSGLILRRLSSEIKYHYRVYPISARSLSLKTLPTFQGHRLLIAKYWSFIRHPNYLGELIIAISLLPLLYFKFAWPPLVAIVYHVIVLVHRTRRIDARMAKFYDSAWTRYKTHVPYSLIPRIY